MSDTLQGLNNLSKLEWLATLDKPSTSRHEASLNVRDLLEGAELSTGNSLGEVLLGDRSLRDGLEDLDGLDGGIADSLSWAGEMDGQKTSIGVGGRDGGDVGAWGRGSGLSEEREPWGPLDGGLSAQKCGENSDLWLISGSRSERAGAWESDGEGVVGGWVGNALLSTIVLGGWGRDVDLWRGLDITEELSNPLGQLGLSGTVGDNGDVGLGVSRLGELGDRLVVEVLREWSGGGWVEWCTETGVECDRVDGVAGDLGGVVLGALLLQVDGWLNLLVVLVCYSC